MEKLKCDAQSLRKFGFTMAVAFTVISVLVFLKHRHPVWIFSGLSVAFLLLGLAVPAWLKPVYIIWMYLAQVLAWINTRIILAAMFYLVITPIGLCMRLFGADLLDIRIEKERKTYWKEAAQKDFQPSDYERQF
jgi:hypothetical protein